MGAEQIDIKTKMKILELRKKGLSAAKTALAVGLSESTVRRCSQQLGFKSKTGPDTNHEHDEEIKRLHVEGCTRKEIKATLHISDETIRRVLGNVPRKETIPKMRPLESYWKPTREETKPELPTEICDGKRYKVVNALFNSDWEV